MPIYFVAPLAGLVGILVCFLWSSLIDRTFRHEPSEWLGFIYLGFLASVLIWSAKYLDEIRAHPYRSLVIAIIAVAAIGWSAIIVWRKAAKWDKDFHNRIVTRPHHR